MDILTHIFLPLVVLIVFKKQFLEKPIYILLLIGFFGIFPDLDKFLGIPGFFHSFITLTFIALIIFAIEYSVKRTYVYSLIIALFLYSHLFLDILDSSPITPLYPLFQFTMYLQFPLVIDFNQFSVSITGPPVKLILGQMNFAFETYNGVITGYGLLSLLLFTLIYLGLKRNKH